MLNKKRKVSSTKDKGKEYSDESRQHGRISTGKVKYKYKNHWVDEELAEVVPYRMKKKKAG